MMLAIYESVARQAWDAVGDRLLAGERKVIFEGEYGQVEFIRAVEDFSQPSHQYMMGGPTKGFVEIFRQGSEVQRVTLRPGEFGLVTHYTTIQLWERDSFLEPDSEQEAEQQNAAEQSAVAPEKEPREFAFMLGRFSYLFITTCKDGFRLCHVSGGKDGEFMRTSFSGFKLLSATPAELIFEQRYDYPYSDDDTHVMRLKLVLTDSPRVPTNRSINYGHWMMTVTGSGGRYEAVKKFLLEHRVDEFWSPQDSMTFRGEPALKGWEADYIHQ